jgi:dihydroorotase
MLKLLTALKSRRGGMSIMPDLLLIKKGRVIDPLTGTDSTLDLFIKNGRVSPLDELPAARFIRVIDAAGLIVAPGLVDMHVHFRDPGFTQKEDLMTGAAAAAAGGFTTVACMPNTSPVLDSPASVADVAERSKTTPINILPYGAVTVSQKGMELTDAAALKAAGAAALSDDGMPVQNAAILRRAMLSAKEAGLLIVSHCEDAELVKNYSVNEGAVSRKLGLPGRPAIAEELMVARDIMLAFETGARLHIAHVSTAGSVDIIRKAKAAGVQVSAETCPQYFTLTEDEILAQGAAAKVNPPLRTIKDIEAITRGLADGTLDAIATDHAPHTKQEKALSLTEAPSGMVGLETALGLALTRLFHEGDFTITKIIQLMSTKPAQILGLSTGRLAIGDKADIVIFDPGEAWMVLPERFHSKGRNTPFAGMTLRGKVKYTIVNGNIVFKGE